MDGEKKFALRRLFTNPLADEFQLFEQLEISFTDQLRSVNQKESTLFERKDYLGH